MLQIIRYTAVCCWGILLTGCDSNRIFENNINIEAMQWAYQDSLQFEVFIEEKSAYNVYVNIRHTPEYEWRNIWLKVEMNTPNDSTAEKLNIQLAQPSGKWFGKCMGNTCNMQHLYKQNVVLDTGQYVFRLMQDMRVNPLPNVMSAGIRLEKAVTVTNEISENE